MIAGLLKMKVKRTLLILFFIHAQVALCCIVYAGGFFETGRVTLTGTIDSGTWITVNMTKTYVNPVVVAGPITHNNDLTLVPRVRNVTSTSFQIGMQSACENVGSIDPPAGPCPPAGGWANEDVSYWVMEEGAWEFPDGQEVEAGIENTNVVRSSGGIGGNQGATNQVNLTHIYATTGVNIYHTINTFNDSDFISTTATRDDSVGFPPTPTAADNDFSLVLEGMEVNSTHGVEGIGWIALETSNGTNAGFNYDAGRTGEDVDRHSDGCFARGPTGITSENIISNVNTMNGNNGSEVRFCSPGIAGRINVHMDEDQVNDDERTGIPEAVTWFVYDHGGFGALDFITGTKTVVDDNGGTLLPGDFLTYTVTLTNELNDFAQADNATNEFEDVLDSNVTFDSIVSASSGTLTHNTGTMEWDGSIPASSTVTLVYRVQVNNNVCGAGGTISNQGIIFMDPNGDGLNSITEVTDDPSVTIAGDTDADNLSDDDDPTQLTIDCTADLQITKDDSSLTYTPGSTATYQIVVTNIGPANISAATIDDDLPNGVTMTAAWNCTASSLNSSCNTVPSTTDPISISIDIASGDTITIDIPVQFSSDMSDY